MPEPRRLLLREPCLPVAAFRSQRGEPVIQLMLFNIDNSPEAEWAQII